MSDLINEVGVIKTNSGKWLDIQDPKPEQIDIHDIAIGLSRLCRFAGQIDRYYSVAQHSILCTDYAHNDQRLAALLHDASEAYLMDIPSPFKALLPDYVAMENRLMTVIARKFNFEWPLTEHIHSIDKLMVRLEWHQLVLHDTTSFTPDQIIFPLSAESVRSMFMIKYQQFKFRKD